MKFLGVPISYLITRGQQVKVFSQLLRKCKEQNLLIPVYQSNQQVLGVRYYVVYIAWKYKVALADTRDRCRHARRSSRMAGHFCVQYSFYRTTTIVVAKVTV